MKFDLTGKVALITGAARGIGLAVAQELAGEGVNIAGIDTREERLADEMRQIVEKNGVEAIPIVANVGRKRQVVASVKRVFAQWGRVDILINNAGIRRVAPVYETATDVWDDVHSTNVRAQFLCTKEVLRQGMLERNEGVIIFVSSDAGNVGDKGSSAYAASKFGVKGFAQSVAKDLKDTKIRTSTILPGRTWTPMAEESEFAEADLDWLDPQRVSNAIVFCIKQDANTIIPELQIHHRSQI